MLPVNAAKTSHSDSVSSAVFLTINQAACSPIGSIRKLTTRVSPTVSISSGGPSGEPSWARTLTPTCPPPQATCTSTVLAAAPRRIGNPAALLQRVEPVTIRMPPLLRGSNVAPGMTVGEPSASRRIGGTSNGRGLAPLTVSQCGIRTLAVGQCQPRDLRRRDLNQPADGEAWRRSAPSSGGRRPGAKRSRRTTAALGNIHEAMTSTACLVFGCPNHALRRCRCAEHSSDPRRAGYPRQSDQPARLPRTASHPRTTWHRRAEFVHHLDGLGPLGPRGFDRTTSSQSTASATASSTSNRVRVRGLIEGGGGEEGGRDPLGGSGTSHRPNPAAKSLTRGRTADRDAAGPVQGLHEARRRAWRTAREHVNGDPAYRELVDAYARAADRARALAIAREASGRETIGMGGTHGKVEMPHPFAGGDGAPIMSLGVPLPSSLRRRPARLACHTGRARLARSPPPLSVSVSPSCGPGRGRRVCGGGPSFHPWATPTRDMAPISQPTIENARPFRRAPRR